MKGNVLHAIECVCPECLDKWEKIEKDITSSKCLCIHALDGYETYKIDEHTIGVRPIWFDAKKNPPDENEHVLVYDTTEGICRGYLSYGSWQHFPLGSFAGDGCLFSVTHWMQLPKAPK